MERIVFHWDFRSGEEKQDDLELELHLNWECDEQECQWCEQERIEDAKGRNQ